MKRLLLLLALVSAVGVHSACAKAPTEEHADMLRKQAKGVLVNLIVDNKTPRTYQLRDPISREGFESLDFTIEDGKKVVTIPVPSSIIYSGSGPATLGDRRFKLIESKVIAELRLESEDVPPGKPRRFWVSLLPPLDTTLSKSKGLVSERQDKEITISKASRVDAVPVQLTLEEDGKSEIAIEEAL